MLSIEKNAVEIAVKEIELKGFKRFFDAEKFFVRVNKYYPNIYKVEVSEVGNKIIVKA